MDYNRWNIRWNIHEIPYEASCRSCGESPPKAVWFICKNCQNNIPKHRKALGMMVMSNGISKEKSCIWASRVLCILSEGATLPKHSPERNNVFLTKPGTTLPNAGVPQKIDWTLWVHQSFLTKMGIHPQPILTWTPEILTANKKNQSSKRPAARQPWAHCPPKQPPENHSCWEAARTLLWPTILDEQCPPKG